MFRERFRERIDRFIVLEENALRVWPRMSVPVSLTGVGRARRVMTAFFNTDLRSTLRAASWVAQRGELYD